RAEVDSSNATKAAPQIGRRYIADSCPSNLPRRHMERRGETHTPGGASSRDISVHLTLLVATALLPNERERGFPATQRAVLQAGFQRNPRGRLLGSRPV